VEARSGASAGIPGSVAAPDRSASPEGGLAVVAPPARQRWRLVLARPGSPDARAGRELSEAWDDALEASGLPVHRLPGKDRARVLFGAPVPAVITLDHELADVLLTALVPRWRVREALDVVVPAGWRLADLYDVWLGEPPLAGQVAAADYRIELDVADATGLIAAAARLMAAAELPRERAKGGEMVRYDLRPLLADVTVTASGPPVVVRMRTRFDPVLGTGRPEEVVAALGEAMGSIVEARSITRERVLLASELD
jgi:uncharacterized protein DUF2344